MQCKPEYSVAESLLRMVVDGRVWHQFLDTINNRTLISVVTSLILAILGAHVEHCYARLFRTPDLEILFLWEGIATNSM